jgi:hypothetical protein|tara:strand:+ start:75 stop:470 length:396 start_codon:yes stop_codon:yes gene_type:complete
MIKHLFSITTIVSCIFFISCTKTPGLGGKAKINIHVIKSLDNGNALNLANTAVMVLYNGKSFPGINAQGDDIKQTNEDGLAIFDNLKKGDYYFFVNTIISDSSYSGGHFTTIESRKGEVHIVIDLGEQDPY